jgi:hypothetical protein
MFDRRFHRTALCSLGALLAVALMLGVAGVRAGAPDGALSADLDGKVVPLTDVGHLRCHDFDYPRIHCYSSDAAIGAAVEAVLGTDSAASVSYVLIYDHASFNGSYMYVSQNYVALFVIGWNDRISSFKAVNGESGIFFTDWYYGGSSWSFCCNQQVSSLGGYDDSFSSVQRT